MRIYDHPIHVVVETLILSMRGEKEAAREALSRKDDELNKENFPVVYQLFPMLDKDGDADADENVNRDLDDNLDDILEKWLDGEEIDGLLDRPEKISYLFERFYLEQKIDRPISLTMDGLLDDVSFTSHNRHLMAYTCDGEFETKRKFIERCRQSKRDLERFELAELSKTDQISYKVMLGLIKNAINGEKFIEHEYLFSQMTGIQIEAQMCMTDYHKLEDISSVYNYLSRLSEFEDVFGMGCMETVSAVKKGIYPPKSNLTIVISSLDKLTPDNIKDNIYYVHLSNALDKMDIDTDLKVELLGKCENILENSVQPAYKDLRNFLSELYKKVANTHGVSVLPNGDEYYQWLIQDQTTTDLSPEQIHQMGLEHVSLIQANMKDILINRGFNLEEIPMADAIECLNKDPIELYDNTDDGRSELLEGYRKMIDEIEPKLDTLFKLQPKNKCHVRRMEKSQEEGAPPAYYCPPSADGSRPGTFYVNARDTRDLPKFAMRNLTLHEAIPGHHFQLALAQEINGIPAFIKYPEGGFNAYWEGWALYCEQLGLEYDFFESDLEKLSHYIDNVWRALRLVVDTGMHSMNWTRDQCIKYMAENSGMSKETIESEVDRYFVMPAQALGYKVGHLKILELRQKAQKELGDKFDIRDFHAAVIGSGSLQLYVLEDVVDNYINSI